MKDLVHPGAIRRGKWATYGLSVLLVAATIPLFYWASRALYPYMESLRGWGYLGVFLSAFITALTAFVPSPLGPASFSLAVVATLVLNPYLTILVYGFGGALGEGSSYLLGMSGRRILTRTPAYEKVERWRKRYGTGWVVLAISCVPLLPFDFVAVVAGMVRYSFPKFLLFATLGRTLRFLVLILVTVGALRRFFGIG